MITLTTGGTLKGKAGTTTAITYTIYGDSKTASANAYQVLGQGQLPTSTGDLLTTTPVPASTSYLIKEIHLSNATGGNVSGVVFYVNGTAAANQVTGTMTIAANGTAVYDGSWHMYDAAGVEQYVGSTGPSGTMAVNSTTTLAPASSATVANVGTAQAALLNFGIPAGSVWRSGSGVPSNGTGLDGDYYLRTSNSDVYLRSSGTYSVVANLQGIQGTTGAAGVVQTVTATNTTLTAGGTAADPSLKRTAITGDVTIADGSNTSVLAAGSASNLNSGTLAAGRLPALTGDVTSSAGSAATTLAAGSAGNLNSGTLPAARLPALTGDVVSTVNTAATTVNKINGTTLSALATGLLKNTTGTGVPSIAAAADVPTVPSGSAVGTGRSIATTAPITGGGDLSADRTIAISAATTSAAGSQSGADKLKEDNLWYDIVSDGGADRSGSVDATSIIQAGINAVAAAGGGVVYIPRGSFKVSSAITITGNFVTVRGASRVASKLVPTHATGNVFTVSGIFNRFEFLRIEPASFLTRTANYAIEFTSTASNCGCQWVDILGMWSAVRATGQLCRLEDMNIRECGYGAANGCMVLIDSFTDQYLSKLVFDNGTVGPNAPQATFAGIRITNLSSLLMSDCQVIHCQVGLDVSPASTNTIPSIYCMNTFFDNGTIGARFTSGSGNIYRCRFMGVWFSSNSTAGAVLNGASINGLDFIGCEFYGNPLGIDAQAAVEWGVRASRFAGNTANAIKTTAGAAHSFSITDCIIGNVSGFGANAQGINIQAGTYKRYQILDNRGLESNTTPGIIDLGAVAATDQKNVGNNMGGVLKGAIATLAAPLSVPVTTETLVLSARIPANGVSVGQVFKIRAVGVMSGANAVTWKCKVGAAGTAAGDAACWTAIIAPVGAANARHGCEITLTVRSLGAPGSVQAEGVQHSSTATVMTWQAAVVAVAATTAATTTADWFVDVTLTQTVGTSLIQQAVIEAL